MELVLRSPAVDQSLKAFIRAITVYNTRAERDNTEVWFLLVFAVFCFPVLASASAFCGRQPEPARSFPRRAAKKKVGHGEFRHLVTPSNT
jgi:hypothetical protein